MTAYFISGLGANEKVFSHIKLPENFKKKFISWKQPFAKESLSSYTRRMADEVNVKEPFILIGLSFGGIIVQEMNRFVKPEQTIIISSIKSRSEMRTLFRVAAKTKLYRLIPVQVLLTKKILFYLYHRKKDQSRIEFFFENLTPHYVKWSIEKFIHWDATINIKNLHHIHGGDDIIFPAKKLKAKVHLISGGTHALILQKAKKINNILNDILTRKPLAIKPL